MTPATAGRKRSRCKVYCRSVGLLLAALCAFALFQPARASADGTVTMASVNIAKLNIRASASARARAVASAALGDVVRVTASKTVSKETWYDVSTSSGKSGWCQARYLSLETDESSFKPSSNGLLDWPSECINVTQKFTYQSCMQDMSAIVAAYPGLARIETIGTSVMGNPIDAIVLGNPDAQTKILVQASIHARELMSGLVALRQAECLLKAASMGASYKDTKVSDLLANEEIWIVPLSNPDGARLVYEGLAAVPPSMPGLAAALKKYNNGSTNFYHWKANADGVDLNRNFDDHWKPDPKYPKPNFQNYPGPAPFSEPESVALRDLTVAKDFALTISYHESGRMIYLERSLGRQPERFKPVHRQGNTVVERLHGAAGLQAGAGRRLQGLVRRPVQPARPYDRVGKRLLPAAHKQLRRHMGGQPLRAAGRGLDRAAQGAIFLRELEIKTYPPLKRGACRPATSREA